MSATPQHPQGQPKEKAMAGATQGNPTLCIFSICPVGTGSHVILDILRGKRGPVPMGDCTHPARQLPCLPPTYPVRCGTGTCLFPFAWNKNVHNLLSQMDQPSRFYPGEASTGLCTVPASSRPTPLDKITQLFLNTWTFSLPNNTSTANLLRK